MFHIPHPWLPAVLLILLPITWQLSRRALYRSIRKLQEYISVLHKTHEVLQLLQTDLKTIADSRDRVFQEVRHLASECDKQISQFRTQLEALQGELDNLKQ